MSVSNGKGTTTFLEGFEPGGIGNGIENAGSVSPNSFKDPKGVLRRAVRLSDSQTRGFDARGFDVEAIISVVNFNWFLDEFVKYNEAYVQGLARLREGITSIDPRNHLDRFLNRFGKSRFLRSVFVASGVFLGALPALSPANVFAGSTPPAVTAPEPERGSPSPRQDSESGGITEENENPFAPDVDAFSVWIDNLPEDVKSLLLKEEGTNEVSLTEQGKKLYSLLEVIQALPIKDTKLVIEALLKSLTVSNEGKISLNGENLFRYSSLNQKALEDFFRTHARVDITEVPQMNARAVDTETGKVSSETVQASKLFGGETAFVIITDTKKHTINGKTYQGVVFSYNGETYWIATSSSDNTFAKVVSFAEEISPSEINRLYRLFNRLLAATNIEEQKNGFVVIGHPVLSKSRLARFLKKVQEDTATSEEASEQRKALLKALFSPDPDDPDVASSVSFKARVEGDTQEGIYIEVTFPAGPGKTATMTIPLSDIEKLVGYDTVILGNGFLVIYDTYGWPVLALNLNNIDSAKNLEDVGVGGAESITSLPTDEKYSYPVLSEVPRDVRSIFEALTGKNPSSLNYIYWSFPQKDSLEGAPLVSLVTRPVPIPLRPSPAVRGPLKVLAELYRSSPTEFSLRDPRRGLMPSDEFYKTLGEVFAEILKYNGSGKITVEGLGLTELGKGVYLVDEAGNLVKPRNIKNGVVKEVRVMPLITADNNGEGDVTVWTVVLAKLAKNNKWVRNPLRGDDSWRTKALTAAGVLPVNGVDTWGLVISPPVSDEPNKSDKNEPSEPPVSDEPNKSDKNEPSEPPEGALSAISSGGIPYIFVLTPLHPEETLQAGAQQEYTLTVIPVYGYKEQQNPSKPSVIDALALLEYFQLYGASTKLSPSKNPVTGELLGNPDSHAAIKNFLDYYRIPTSEKDWLSWLARIYDLNITSP